MPFALRGRLGILSSLIISGSSPNYLGERVPGVKDSRVRVRLRTISRQQHLNISLDPLNPRNLGPFVWINSFEEDPSDLHE